MYSHAKLVEITNGWPSTHSAQVFNSLFTYYYSEVVNKQN